MFVFQCTVNLRMILLVNNRVPLIVKFYFDENQNIWNLIQIAHQRNNKIISLSFLKLFFSQNLEMWDWKIFNWWFETRDDLALRFICFQMCSFDASNHRRNIRTKSSFLFSYYLLRIIDEIFEEKNIFVVLV